MIRNCILMMKSENTGFFFQNAKQKFKFYADICAKLKVSGNILVKILLHVNSFLCSNA